MNNLYHSNFNFECNTERGLKESLGLEPLLKCEPNLPPRSLILPEKILWPSLALKGTKRYQNRERNGKRTKWSKSNNSPNSSPGHMWRRSHGNHQNQVLSFLFYSCFRVLSHAKHSVVNHNGLTKNFKSSTITYSKKYFFFLRNWLILTKILDHYIFMIFKNSWSLCPWL